MKKSINEYEFINGFKNSIYKNKFTYQGLQALFKYLEELERDIQEEIEFDLVSIACDYTEYENLEDIKKDYNIDIKTIEDLSDYTDYIKIINENIIIENF